MPCPARGARSLVLRTAAVQVTVFFGITAIRSPCPLSLLSGAAIEFRTFKHKVPMIKPYCLFSGGAVAQLGFFEQEDMKSQVWPSVIIRMLYFTSIHHHSYFLEKLIGEGIPASALHSLQTKEPTNCWCIFRQSVMHSSCHLWQLKLWEKYNQATQVSTLM